MKIEADAELRKQALGALRSEYNMEVQRPGLHQSELSHCLSLSYWDRTDPQPIDETRVLLFAVGFGLERVLLGREQTPEPIVLDGITLSLDSLKLFGPVDLKSTRMRAAGRKGEDGFQFPPGWIRQMAAYRYTLNQLIPDASVSLYEATDDSQSFGVIVVHLVEPEISAWRITYTPEELQSHWDWLLQRKVALERMLATESPEPFHHNEEWECGQGTNHSCSRLLSCQLFASLHPPENVIPFTLP